RGSSTSARNDNRRDRNGCSTFRRANLLSPKRKLTASLKKNGSEMSAEFPKKEMETLWCPWRVEYFEREKPNADFLEAAAQASDHAAHLLITRRRNAFLVTKHYPYAAGDSVAVPSRNTDQ